MTSFSSLSRLLAASALLIAATSTVQASQITYQPTNPIFQPGNAFNGPALLAIAEEQRPADPRDSVDPLSQRTIGETVQAALVSRLTTDLYNEIFDGSNLSGTFDLGNGSLISYLRSGGNVTITLVDPVNGNTVITVPDTL